MKQSPLARFLSRKANIYSLAHSLADQEGVAVEIGVYRGASARVIKQALPDHPLYLFDTFCGMPVEGEWDNYHQSGDFWRTSVEVVLRNLWEFRGVYLRAGIFRTLETLEDQQVLFAHVDCDLYQSTKKAIEEIRPRLVPSGIILFDDYGAETCLGARKAIDEACLKGLVKLNTGQAFWVGTKEAQ